MEVTKMMIEFVQAHEKDDVNALRLKYSGEKSKDFDFNIDFALLQIEARKKSRHKIPEFLSHPDFVFPTLLSSEQASNETVAKFHANLIKRDTSLLDLTAGLGIDAMTFAKQGINVTACEIDTIKCENLRHNAMVMRVADKLVVINKDSIEYIKQSDKNFDVVYADPARRNTSGSKVHALSDCQPDILASIDDILAISPRILIKSSPLLDLTLIRNTVKELQHIYVVCFKGECKEVLIDIRKDSSFDGVIVVDLDWEGELSRFYTPFNDSSSLSKSPLCDHKLASDYRYIYEPNAGVMKTGAWASLVAKFPALSKADVNTNIFLSDAFYSGFPGRVMEIIAEPDKRALKSLKGEKINIVSRNHPLSVDQISKKFSLTAGSNNFLYAFRYLNNPTIIITNPIKQNDTQKGI